MKIAVAVFCFLSLAGFLAPRAHATDFVFSSFQRDPSECLEETAPATVASAFVSFNATCTGGVVSTIEGSALAEIGTPEPCTVPYIAFAQVQQSTKTELDDFGCPFNLSSVTQTAKIFSSSGVEVFSTEAGSDCQGGTFGPTNDGIRPC